MKKFFITIILFVGAGLVFYYGFGGKNISRFNLDISPSESPVEEQGALVELVEPDEIFAEPVVYGSLKETYSHAGFSFKYPGGFKVSSTPVSTTQEVVTIENEKGTGFQIFILAWDESGPITPERIWQDMPDADVIDPKNAELDGVKTLVFYGYNEDMGETFEAWVVRKGKLYQIAGPRAAEQLIVETLETWRWK